MSKQYLSERVKRENGNPELLGKIESARSELNRLIRTEGTESKKVLELSRGLDRLLLEYYGGMSLVQKKCRMKLL